MAQAIKSDALNDALIKESEAKNDDSKIMVWINRKDLNKVIIKKIAQKEQPKQTWANIAANGSRSTGGQSAASATATTPQAKIIPTQQMRQLTVQAPGMADDLKMRDNKAIIIAVNNASPTKHQAVAVTRLQSGNHIISFEEGARKWYTENTSWVQKAFRETVELVGQTYIVLAKYLPIKYVRQIEAD